MGELLLQVNLIEEWSLPADHLLHRVDASDVFMRQVFAGPIDSANNKKAAFPADQLLEVELRADKEVAHDRCMSRMDSAAYVAVENAVLECEHVHARVE